MLEGRSPLIKLRNSQWWPITRRSIGFFVYFTKCEWRGGK